MRLTQVFAFAPIIVFIFTTSLSVKGTETRHSLDSYSKFDGIEEESEATGYMKLGDIKGEFRSTSSSGFGRGERQLEADSYMKLGDIKGESLMNGLMKLGDIKADYRLERSYDDFEQTGWWKELERLIWEAEADDFIWEDEAEDF